MRVSAVIKTKKGYLLFHRFWKGNEYYCTPGGHVEKEEKPKDALVRECFEELQFLCGDEDLSLFNISIKN